MLNSIAVAVAKDVDKIFHYSLVRALALTQSFKRVLEGFQFCSADFCFQCWPVLTKKYVNLKFTSITWSGVDLPVLCVLLDCMLSSGVRGRAGAIEKANEIGRLFCSGSSREVLLSPAQPRALCPWVQCPGFALQLCRPLQLWQELFCSLALRQT